MNTDRAGRAVVLMISSTGLRDLGVLLLRTLHVGLSVVSSTERE
jgi:hypothetical protein